jgi:PAS domain S-box-containing protein
MTDLSNPPPPSPANTGARGDADGFAAPFRALSQRQILAISVALLVLLAAATAFLAINHVFSVRQTRHLVRHSHEVIQTTQSLFSVVQNVESAQRAFMLTKDERFLNTFAPDQAAARALMKRLDELTADNPSQNSRVKRFDDQLLQRLIISGHRLDDTRKGAPTGPHGHEYMFGKHAMDNARAAMNDILQSENRLLEQRSAAANSADERGFIAALIAAAVALAGVTVGMLSMAGANRRLVHEIAEREGAETAQRESQALYRAIFANTSDYLYVIDVSPDGVFSVAELNPAFEQATRITTLATRGRDITLLDPGGGAAALADYYKRVVAGGKPVFRRSSLTLKDVPRTWETVLAPVRNEQGRIDRIVGSSRDVTDRDQAEEQLRRSQRMEAVGHLTGGVAHDFNNLLQVIRGNLELIAPAVADNAQASQRVKNALHGANRAAELTRQLLAFARRQPLEPKAVNLGRLVTDMTELMRRTLGEGVEVETVIAGGLWNTLADPAQVESALLNLAINARDAMDGGGRLTVEITNAVLDESYTRRDAEIEPGQYVLMAVSDTGHGMSPETVARVFEPFFTTKGEEKGTGLGLSMVYGFVKQSNGHVQIYSEVGQGTTVKIYLPRVHEIEAVEETIDMTSLRGRSEVILVVEDDDLVRASAVGMLRDLGYTCIHASDAAAALEMIKSGAKIDLLFTDVIMPGPLRSRDLAIEAERLQPGLPVLFTSGYTENAIVHHGRLDPGVQLLSKPYTRDDLARKMRSLLTKRRPVVLVVEDDALVRMSAADMIESLGFTPIQAADASQALASLNGDGRIDILFTDIGLPGMRGPELAVTAAGLRPNLKIIFSSGYGEGAEGADAVEGAVHLGKPYQQEQLAKVLTEALG